MNEDPTQKLSEFEAHLLTELRAISQRLSQMEQRLSQVEQELVDSRRHTRPLWDSFLMRLTTIEQTVQSINAQIGEFAREFFAQRGRIALIEEQIRHRPPAA